MPGSREDERFMAAAIRLSRRHMGLTATNPSVATLIVTPGGTIVGRGITARGGRPHAEPVALAEAGDQARGATAYVSLEPCAHHGRTPPCAEALITAGVARVVGGASDPDDRVSGKGYDMLRAAGIEVTEDVLADDAADAMAGYLIRSVKKRPEVILKLAVSSDGMIGREGEGQVAITGAQARARAHMMRAQTDAILIGSRTALTDDPELTCRLPGLEQRSPARIVVGNTAGMNPGSKLLSSARQIPLWLVVGDGIESMPPEFSASGARLLACETVEGRVALPELMEDLASQGVMSVLVEGGANIAASFLTENLVDRIVLFTADKAIGENGIRSPLQTATVPENFELARDEKLGEDRCMEWIRKERF